MYGRMRRFHVSASDDGGYGGQQLADGRYHWRNSLSYEKAGTFRVYRTGTGRGCKRGMQAEGT